MGGRGFRHFGRTVWPGFSDISPRHVAKIGRNDPCPCGGGKKYKDCHEKQGTAWLEKIAAEQDRRARRAAKGSGDSSAPWYKRLFRRS